MIINKFLQLFSEEYAKTKSITKLIEFTKKTFPSDGTDKIFIGCVLIMFDQGFNGLMMVYGEIQEVLWI